MESAVAPGRILLFAPDEILMGILFTPLIKFYLPHNSIALMKFPSLVRR
jgi:hypothetical protein